jgi:hypothetical protein
MKNLSVYKKTNSVLRGYILAIASFPITTLPMMNLEVTLISTSSLIVFIIASYFGVYNKYSVSPKKSFKHEIKKSSLKSCRRESEIELHELLSRFMEINKRYQITEPKYKTIYTYDFFYQEWYHINDEKKFSEIIDILQICCIGVSKRSDAVIELVCDKWRLVAAGYNPSDLYILQIIQHQILLSLGYSDDVISGKSVSDTFRFILENCLGYRLESGKIQTNNVHDTLSPSMFSNILEISLIGLSLQQVKNLKNSIKYALLCNKDQIISENMFDFFELLYGSSYGTGFSTDKERNLLHADGIFLKDDEKTLEFKTEVHKLVEQMFCNDDTESYWEIENRILAIVH